MTIERFVVGQLQTNCYLLHEANEAIIVDPGDESIPMEQIIQENHLSVRYILNTHGHFDHVLANLHYRKKYSAEILIGQDDAAFLSNPMPQISAIFGVEQPACLPDRTLVDGDRIEFAGRFIQTLHTPGHSPGSFSFLFDKCLLVGDLVFRESVGRTDLPGGDFDLLKKSITQKILIFEDHRILPGHGEDTTTDHERHHNPFLV